MRISSERRRETESRIRAAMDRLLRGEVPIDGKCDVQTLAREAAVTRAALYSTYQHLKTEFDQRRQQLQNTGVVPDPRQAQITRLKQAEEKLRAQIGAQQDQLTEATLFRTTALSRLAAQHEEILRLRDAITDYTNIRPLRPAGD
ncbi:hypothetical protein [Nocardia noduli]|uniref:hypothetical protein n=1 Tax=Nocardia noduli TaxID=2815722 RepID=UPI001C24A43D|nr:hypothetical protein [Nocardia noduli]